MKPETEVEHSTHEITTRPKTPHRRPPLPRMMEIRPSDTRTYESKEDDTSRESEIDDDRTETRNSSSDDSECDPEVSKPIRRRAATVTDNSESKISSPLFQTISSSRKKPNESKAAHYSEISSEPCSTDYIDSKRNIKSKWSLSIWHCIILFVLIVPIIVYWNNAFNLNANTVGVETFSTFEDVFNDFAANIDNINDKFKNQNSKIWDEIYAGVVNVKKHPKKRSIIFLFSNDEDPMSCLARMIGNASKDVLNTDILHLSSSNLGNDYGAVIHKFEEPIKQQRIVIVDNLLEIDVEALRAFHSLCDSEKPLVRQTIYILTMIANGYKSNERPIDFVTKQLEQKLKGKIQPDKLQPLITRITDAAIYPVQPEPDFTSCPLRY